MAQVKPAVAMIDTLLRGVGQVMFQNNPITDLLILAGIGINSYKYSLTVLLGLIVATLAAYLDSSSSALKFIDAFSRMAVWGNPPVCTPMIRWSGNAWLRTRNAMSSRVKMSFVMTASG
jgi:urea transporter